MFTSQLEWTKILVCVRVIPADTATFVSLTPRRLQKMKHGAARGYNTIEESNQGALHTHFPRAVVVLSFMLSATKSRPSNAATATQTSAGSESRVDLRKASSIAPLSSVSRRPVSARSRVRAFWTNPSICSPIRQCFGASYKLRDATSSRKLESYSVTKLSF